MKYIVPVVAIALGIAAIVLGGIDDAPGAQLMGVAFIVGAVCFVVRSMRRSAA